MVIYMTTGWLRFENVHLFVFLVTDMSIGIVCIEL